MPESAPVAAPRRGRPRPPLTIKRDQRIAEILGEDVAKEWTIAEMDEKVGWGKNVVRACFDRLIWGDVARKNGRSAYQATGKPYNPEYVNRPATT